jgi:hypothetical protein
VKTTTKRRIVASGMALIVVLAVGRLAWSAVDGERPDPCLTPPTLETYRNVTLQPAALAAFKEAESRAGRTIEVVQSFRSCSQQALACQRICGNVDGCPGTCAKPGTSYHQFGKAVDLTAAELKRPQVMAAMAKAGWCQPLRATDPGHFSFDGCH